ncbi:MAG TPA: hypothetical protein VMZ29_07590 [Candidatus Bathyarchaeia archaeon]|nr:hypothetical protein [Candidatus Bathyarchaeia archaeon]
MMNFEFKLIFCGGLFAGKSSLIARMLGYDPFLQHVFQGEVCQIQSFSLPFGQIRLLMFDGPAHILPKTNEHIQRNFFIKSSGAFFLFDLTNQESIEELIWWNEKLQQYVPTKVEKFLIATKADLIENEITLSKRIFETNKELETNNIIITSSKTGLNIDLALNAMVYSILKNQDIKI